MGTVIHRCGIAAVHGVGNVCPCGVLLVLHVVGSPYHTCLSLTVAEERMDIVEAGVYDAYDNTLAVVVSVEPVAYAAMDQVCLNLLRHQVHHRPRSALSLYADNVLVVCHGGNV